MDPKAKLYVIVRADLAPGALCAQAVHAALAFAHTHPDLAREWYADSGNLVILAAPDERALYALCERVGAVGVPSASFREPDYADSLTALALAPSGARLVSCLPLALRAPLADRAA